VIAGTGQWIAKIAGRNPGEGCRVGMGKKIRKGVKDE